MNCTVFETWGCLRRGPQYIHNSCCQWGSTWDSISALWKLSAPSSSAIIWSESCWVPDRYLWLLLNGGMCLVYTHMGKTFEGYIITSCWLETLVNEKNHINNWLAFCLENEKNSFKGLIKHFSIESKIHTLSYQCFLGPKDPECYTPGDCTIV